MLGPTREYNKRDYLFSPTGLSPTMAALSRALRLINSFVTLRQNGNPIKLYPTTPIYQRLPAWQHIGLGSFAFAHHYLRNRFYFLFLRVLRCFSSPRYLQPPYIFRRRCTGCPIRKSTDQKIFAPHRSLSQLITSFIGS